MVIARISDGLGNQLFQYALGRRLAIAHNTKLRLDISSYEETTLRWYGLHHFNIRAKVASRRQVRRFTTPRVYGRRDIVLDRLERLGLYHRPTVCREKAMPFDAAVLRAPDYVYLQGFWTTEKYFEDIEPTIRRELTVKDRLEGENAAMAERIRSVESVSLHVRRGDKATDPDVARAFGTCDLSYYARAVELISTSVAEPHFFVFSDDPQWAEENIRLEQAATYVSHNPPRMDYEDLRLMTMCQHHIMANSTFSWWGAWLCENPGKIVAAPQRWFNELDFDTSDLIPERWQCI